MVTETLADIKKSDNIININNISFLNKSKFGNRERKEVPSCGPLCYAGKDLSLEWRSEWLKLSSCSTDGLTLTKVLDFAYGQNLIRIKELFRSRSNALDGYDLACAGSPWYYIGPRNMKWLSQGSDCAPYRSNHDTYTMMEGNSNDQL